MHCLSLVLVGLVCFCVHGSAAFLCSRRYKREWIMIYVDFPHTSNAIKSKGG